MTQLSSGLIAALSGKARDYIANTADAWFGPGNPMPPVAPQPQPARVLDYDFALNMQYQPKTADRGAIAFDQMRALADGYDLLRLVIETRKDQVSKIPFLIRKKQTPGLEEIASPGIALSGKAKRSYDGEMLSGMKDKVKAKADLAAKLQEKADAEDKAKMGKLAPPVPTKEKPLAGDKKPVEFSDEEPKEPVDDPRIKKLHELLEYPDLDHDWSTWIRAVLEEVFVVDALSLAPRSNRKKEVIGFDVIDGTTIVRKIDAQGRTPMPPDVAYQQVIKGMPASNFTTEELIYRVRNYRAHRIYGYSPVEQIVVTINLALRRQMSKLAYYTDGNIPEALASVPETWSADEITRFQNMFDAMKGDVQAQRRLRFIPQLHQFIPTKEALLKDEMDEWLARIVCYCMSVSPQPFIKDQNRASSQVAQDSSISEGLLPILVWLAKLINYLITRYLKIDDLEFAWKINLESDGLKLAQIHKIYVEMDVLDKNEVREELGRPPVPEGAIENNAKPNPLAGPMGRPPGPTGKGDGEQAFENTRSGNTNSKVDTE